MIHAVCSRGPSKVHEGLCRLHEDGGPLGVLGVPWKINDESIGVLGVHLEPKGLWEVHAEYGLRVKEVSM